MSDYCECEVPERAGLLQVRLDELPAVVSKRSFAISLNLVTILGKMDESWNDTDKKKKALIFKRKEL